MMTCIRSETSCYQHQRMDGEEMTQKLTHIMEYPGKLLESLCVFFLQNAQAAL